MKEIKALYNEQKTIKYTIVINLLGAIVCFWIGLKNNSSAIMFDTAYCFMLTFGYFILLNLSKKKIHQPTLQFPLGFQKIQSMIAIFQAFLILLACLFAAYNSINQFIKHEYVENFLEIIIFQFIFLLVCIVMYLYVKASHSEEPSKVLEILALNWVIDIVQSAGLVMSFVIAWLIDQTSYAYFSKYIDPMVLIVLVIFIIPEPIRIIREGFIELLDGNINTSVTETIQLNIIQIMDINFPDVEIEKIRIRYLGQQMFVSLILKKDNDFNSKDLIKISNHLNQELKELDYQYEIFIGISTLF
jgi:cation diffusion facilitator family transporter